MFVGVGAARIRDLFQQAEAKAPCIVFIDELDALGKVRVQSPLGSHEEREQTLNQLLAEMDGFDSRKGVIIMGATNRPEVLDPALLRPGRFDRQVLVDKPDVKGREEILRIHVKGVKVADDVDLKVVAARTAGFAGADLANLVNEAALLAARNDKTSVGMKDFEAAIDRLIAGLEKKRVMSNKERRIVAYHESGHAIVASVLPGLDPVHKISIVQRGFGALGYTMQLPLEDRYLATRTDLLGQLAVLLGGRTAEEIALNEISTGAQNDLQRATDIARAMVTEFGMSDALGAVNYDGNKRARFLDIPMPAGTRPLRRRDRGEDRRRNQAHPHRGPRHGAQHPDGPSGQARRRDAAAARCRSDGGRRAQADSRHGPASTRGLEIEVGTHEVRSMITKFGRVGLQTLDVTLPTSRALSRTRLQARASPPVSRTSGRSPRRPPAGTRPAPRMPASRRVSTTPPAPPRPTLPPA